MRDKLLHMILLVGIFFSPDIFANETETSDRYRDFIKEVRCIVCQHQNLADSSAPIAKDLRERILSLMNEKKSDAEIKNYLVKRYGEFILLRPRFNPSTAILWLFPGIAVISIVLVFLIRLSQPRRRF